LILSDKYKQALALAFDLHRTRERKGSGTPYVAHILGVSSMALEYGAALEGKKSRISRTSEDGPIPEWRILRYLRYIPFFQSGAGNKGGNYQVRETHLGPLKMVLGCPISRG
jgi:hypothetical protein